MKKLHISRDIQMNRVHRLNYGPDFRGHKPIQVCLLNYRDKEEILRKARLLKGSNIYISEDFSRKVREHRNELIKFMKEVKSRDPTRQEQINYSSYILRRPQNLKKIFHLVLTLLLSQIYMVAL